MSGYLRQIVNRIKGLQPSINSLEKLPVQRGEETTLNDPFENGYKEVEQEVALLEGDKQSVEPHRFVDLLQPFLLPTKYKEQKTKTDNLENLPLPPAKPLNTTKGESKKKEEKDQLWPIAPSDFSRKAEKMPIVGEDGHQNVVPENFNFQKSESLKTDLLKKDRTLVDKKKQEELASTLQPDKTKLLPKVSVDKSKRTEQAKQDKVKADTRTQLLPTTPLSESPKAKKEPAPKGLIIGQLNVEIIAPKKTNKTSRNRRRASLPKAKIKRSHFRSKSKFGLGQL